MSTFYWEEKNDILRTEVELLKEELEFAETKYLACYNAKCEVDCEIERLQRMWAEVCKDYGEARAEIERLKALVETAYVEGTCEGRAEAQLGRGRAWIDSKAREALGSGHSGAEPDNGR